MLLTSVNIHTTRYTRFSFTLWLWFVLRTSVSKLCHVTIERLMHFVSPLPRINIYHTPDEPFIGTVSFCKELEMRKGSRRGGKMLITIEQKAGELNTTGEKR